MKSAVKDPLLDGYQPKSSLITNTRESKNEEKASGGADVLLVAPPGLEPGKTA